MSSPQISCSGQALSQAPTTASPRVRVRVRVRGAVQGVGFRPWVHGLATRLGLGGWVCNDAEGVLIEVEGADRQVFLAALRDQPPALARVNAIEVEEQPASEPGMEEGFRILPSGNGPSSTGIVPDAASCDACLDELRDPDSRFYRYAFVTCTHCGPRYSLTRSLPYDRCNTGMADFPMCPACADDYRNPDSRRFHAQATACPRCGPRLSHPVDEIVDRLQAGQIVALKGLGGFHLACMACNEAAVARLRVVKGRDAKPFAVMVADLAAAGRWAELDEAGAALLTAPARPIVLLRRRADPVDTERLAASVAPGLARIGLMLPHTPLQHLLFEPPPGSTAAGGRERRPALTLVMTSANLGGDPLLADNADAQRQLAGIADLVVTHDRPIVARCDDSVTLLVRGQPRLVRRARGHVPDPIDLGADGPAVLAVGGQSKNTVCLTRGREAFVSQHIGDLDRAATRRFFDETVHHLCDLLGVEPELVAHDLHPDYHATRYALDTGLPHLAVQHHRAHIAAVAAEHLARGPLLGLALDGHGLGSDGTSWGGELLLIEGGRFTRLGHLAALPQPGGDRAARQPWRLGAAILHQLGRGAEIASRFAEQPEAGRLAALLDRPRLVPSGSSCGRYFDAAAALLGVREVSSYESQAAMELEARVAQTESLPDGWQLQGETLSLLPLMACLADLGPPGQPLGAALFHGTLIEALADWVVRAAKRTGVRRVACGGGCFLNAILSAGLDERLAAQGIESLHASALPCHDGGLSLGQAWIARQGVIGQEGPPCA
ncbi:carbamoyltransferase HypF [Aquabacterium sp. A7-Y]|uniref:carbamoyltransferase HypF n=1 Tax=Aquabacterium sp. A7-Y TaxID=1349605 RepID=UPI00223E090A|nr:carbamoyltransferase HypF [Aquabacterium sp. A7-Y]MCW7541121.1 carbamoyltransferase HypF [Aquabacterium sp. A7-Y]